MKITLHAQATPQGVLIPAHLLAQAGIQDQAEITVEHHAIVLRAPARQGWAEASRALAETGDDTPVWPEFANAEDDEWQW